MKHLKKVLSIVLAFAMLAPTVPAFASDLEDDAAESAARRLIASQKYFYNPSGVSISSEGEYPETFDLRSANFDGSGEPKNYVTPVKSQGYFGTCWGFAATAAAETSILTDLGMSYDEMNIDLSEHHVAWFANVALPEDGSEQGGEGVYFIDPPETSRDILDYGGGSTAATSVYSAGVGPMPEYMFPYRGKEGNIIYINPETGRTSKTQKEGYEPHRYSPDDDWSLDEADRFGQVYPLEESFLLPSPAQFEYDETEEKYKYVYNQAGTDAIKEQLMNGRPVCISFFADTSVASEMDEHHYINPATWAHYVPLSVNEDSENGESTNHVVTIVGWDDNFSKKNFFETPPGDGAWIVKNSWGSDESEFPNKGDWGDHGYFYISYYDHTMKSPEALDFDVTPDKTGGSYYSFKYDYMPVFASYKNNVFDAPASMSNVFENGDMDVTAKTLTFYTELPGTETTFEMYMLSDQSESPTDGELLASGTKTYKYGGYHRFDLEEPVYIPANARYSVVVTNKTADGKYEIISQEYPSELSAKTDKVTYGSNTDYAKGVVNKGESFIKTTNENSEAEWADWGETSAAANEISCKFLEELGFMSALAQTEDAFEAYNNASDAYYEAHPEDDSEVIPEELRDVYADWQRKALMLKVMKIAIKNGLAAILNPEYAETFSSAAFYARDNFPITVIADVAKKDHILYYDSATSQLYSKMDYDTKEFSEPIDFPGAICEGNKLTLTSDFQFVTTAKDGLFIDGNTTLYVPKGESPSIVSAVDGFKGDDKLNEYTGIFAADGSTIDIDGSLTVRSGTGTDASGRAILSDGDLKITGDGSLEAICGNTEHDETAEPMRADSIGIYVYGDLDISVADARFIGGDAYGMSIGIATDEAHSVTVGGGASVVAQSGATLGDEEFYDDFYSLACNTSYVTVKDNSSFIASASATDKNEKGNYGLSLLCGDIYGDGNIYNCKITLSNNSSLILNADGSERSFGIFSGENMPIPVETDSTCTFIAAGTTKASHYAELAGVTATSQDGKILAYTKGTDGLTNSYVDTDGNIAQYIAFKKAEDVSEGDKILYFDGETGKLYSKYDFHTGEMSDPVEVPGAICEKNKLTLTSEFRFVTAHEDGLYLSDGSTLYVPEGETPYIQSAAAGFTRTDTSICASGINVVGDLMLDIDGTLTVIAGDGVNIDSFGVACEGNLTITGNGTLNAFGGNTSHDESVQDGETASAGILAYKNIDISNAEVNAYGGDAYDDSEGIETWPGGSLTISGGAQVKAEGGSSADTTFQSAAIGCEVSEIVIKDHSSLTASAVSNKGILNVGLNMNSDAADDNGTTYNGRIKLENNSSLSVRALNSEYNYGIYQANGPFDGPIKTEMDDTCTFTSDAGVAGLAQLEGVTAMSGENVVTFDSEEGCYTDADGKLATSLTFRPKASSRPGRGGGGGFSSAAPTATPTAAPTDAPQATPAPEATKPSGTGALPFTDVNAGDWFYDAVKAAYDKGIINGVSDTEFAPDEELTRGMLVTIIGRADGFTQSNGALPGDVDMNQYYAPYIAWAAANGIVNGFEDGTFRPDDAVTREQTAAILYRYMQYKGADVSVGENTNILSYTDANEISEYAVSAIQWACGAGVINGYPDGTLAPTAGITRAEFAMMIDGLDSEAAYDEDNVDYSDMSNWAYFESDDTGKAADVFFVCPTVYMGKNGIHNMELSDEKTKASFLGATNMEKGIYDDDSRFFAPYYRQAALDVYKMDGSESEQYLEYAYRDVKAAFEYYCKNCNDGRPIILAGFSQGADMCIRLMRDYFSDADMKDRLVACYAVGWRLTEDETAKYPQIVPATGESDTGVVISFTCEAEDIDNSIIIPKGEKSFAINPLNWKTDGTPADKNLNLGACFTDYDGNIKNEVPKLTGAYIDGTRGALKVTDVTPEEYPPGLDVFQSGVYHLYDYQFFYRNLEENVKTRLEAYEAHK